MRKKRFYLILRTKKAVAIWMSWVLLTAFMVALSTFMYDWIINYSESSAEDIDATYRGESCSETAMKISGCQDSENLKLEIENKGNLKITGLIFRLYDIYGDIESKEKDITIKAGKIKYADILKQGTIQMLQSIPVLDDGSVCRDKMHTLENITTC